MSRHRDIRNLDIQDELNDDAISDGGEYEVTPEQDGQLNDGLEQVRSIIGDEDVSGLSDNSIKEVLWEYYFNVEKTVQWALDEQEKRRIAKERKETSDDPHAVHGQELNHQHYQYSGHGPSFDADDNVQEYHEINNGPRLPSIFLAQQQPGFDNEAYLAVDSPRPLKTFLSTISERTERTDPSTPYRSRQHRLTTSSRSFVSSPTTSYGNELDDRMSGNWQDPYNDPNTSRHSPSHSAIELLSKFEPPPSNDSTSTITPDDVHLRASEPMTSLDNIPTIPDLESKASEPVNRRKSLPPTPTSIPSRSQSKLSRLASSKTSSVASVSSRSSGTSVTGSIKTFPNLRPSAQSERPGSPTSVASSKSLPPIPPQSDAPEHTRQTSTSTSSLVRKAIETALQLEDFDRLNLTTPKRDLHRPTPLPDEEDDRSTTPTPTTIGKIRPVSQSTEPKPPSTSPISKLALLAQKRAESTTASTGSVNSPVNLPSPAPSTISQDFRPLSKLAILAQQKVDASKKPNLPKPTTEYLTPIANGSSVTTAITTSYQSLFSLTDPSKPNFIPKLNVVPLQAVAPVSPSDQKQSKLAAKIQRAGKKPVSPGFPSEEEIVTPPLPPLFLPNSSARGSPSAFASVLISDLESAKDKGKKDAKRKSKEKVRKREAEKAESVEKVESPSDSHPHRSRKHKNPSKAIPSEGASHPHPFTFDGPSPDDIVLNARKGTSLDHKSTRSPSTPAKEREKALKQSQMQKSMSVSRGNTPAGTPTKGAKKNTASIASGASTPARKYIVDQQQLDISGLNLDDTLTGKKPVVEEPPKVGMAREKVLEEAKRALEADEGRKGISIVVIGHVDAGKSTLMGRLLFELGRLDEKTRRANERGSEKIGKGSFSWAWGLDGTTEERERGITMDIAMQTFETPHRVFTLLDAPGHKDFIPNMISGASQADCALLVVDSATGEFEAGFDRGGQTREHLLLVRSLGVSQVIVAVNKLDQVDWSNTRYEEICSILRPFLVQSGFQPSKSKFVPVGAMQGVNLVNRDNPNTADSLKWYNGPTLVDLLDKLVPPIRDIRSPMRLPISNVFKGQSSGSAVSGRLSGGVVQVGEKLRVLPGDETAIVKSIEIDDSSALWAAAGSNVTLHLTSIDPVQLGIGSVLCPFSDPVPLATSFTARIIVFDIEVPITSGTSVEIFQHSKDVLAIVKLMSTIDRTSGKVIKHNPRVLTKGVSAEVQFSLRKMQVGGVPSMAPGIPLETFASNKDMGRVLIRRGGETIAAGVITEIKE